MTTHVTSYCPLCKASVLCAVSIDGMAYYHDAADSRANWVRHAWRITALYADKKGGYFIESNASKDPEDWRKGIAP